MSSALKPALTPSGAQNPPVPSQLNKPIHTQGSPTTYNQPSHLPQNLVNIPHNAPTTPSVHNPPMHPNTHSVPHHLSSNVHSANHYSLNVPNASQHYPISGNVAINTHSAPVSNHPVNTVPAPTFSPSPKNLSYTPNYQANLGYNKTPTATTMPASMPTVTLPQPVPTIQTPSDSTPAPEKQLQSNGTPDIKIADKPEPAQNHVAKEKPPQLPPPEIQTPSTPEKAKTMPEEPSEIIKPESPKVEKDNRPAEVEEDDVVAPSVEDEEEEAPVAAAVAPEVVDSTDNSVNAVSSTDDNNCSNDLEMATVDTNDESSLPTEPSPTAEVPENDESQDSSSPINVTPIKVKEQNQKTPAKAATITPKIQPKKPKVTKDVTETPKVTKSDTKAAVQKSPGSGGKSKRTRIKTQPYQSPLPEVEMISKITATTPRSKNIEDKLIIFYKNEFLAVRNSEGGFYICQAVQNIYKSSPRIRIRWLSQDKNDKELYTPDFYDNTDFDCILTNLNLIRSGKGKYKLPAAEKVRTDSILKRALAVEKGDEKPTSLTEEHPDGLDLSLYKEESQLKKRTAVKRKAGSPIKAARSSSNTSKSPDQSKVQKVSPKPKPPPVKKATVLKKTLAIKAKKNVVSNRTERATKRQADEPKPSVKTVTSVIDQKKAKVLAKVARKAVVPQPKIQPPPKQSAKISKLVVASKKPPPTKKFAAAVMTRKSKRGKK